MEFILTATPVHHRDRDDADLANLLERVADGDDKALAALYDETSALVLGIASRVLRERDIAEEAVLEVFVQVWNEARGYDRARGSVRSWLVVLARSRAIDIARKRTTRTGRETTLDQVAEFADVRPGPEAASLARERAARIRRAMSALPAEQQRAIEAAFYGGLTHSEVAASFGEPIGTIKTRIRRGLLSLREVLRNDLEAFA